MNVLEFLEQIKDKEHKGVYDEFGFASYLEIQKFSEQIGSSLAQYISINMPVAVYMEKSILALESFFGILYAGGCYSFLNPELPDERLKNIITVLDAKVIVTNEDFYSQALTLFPNFKIFKVEELKRGLCNYDILQFIRSKKIDMDPLYINFTSGSTGVPKGVVVNHHSVLDFITYFTDIFHITDEDVLANQAPLDFDVSVKDIYSALKVGANLVLVPRTYFSNPMKLMDMLVDYKVTTMIWAVSALCLISTFHGLDYKPLDHVNKVLFSGEVMPIKHLKSWMDHLPKATFVNLYGPTEITCNCTYHILDRKREYDKIPIGNNFPNEDVFLLGNHDEVVDEPLKVGEICVRSSELALGYFNNWVEINKRFVQNPKQKYYLDLIYRTGDLGYYNEQKELFFSGRKDFQIKYMGHRIELEEIERAIHNVMGIERCCVLFLEEKNRLVAFYVGQINESDVRQNLKERLPIYMLPTKWIVIPKFPLTKNGKIDRKALERMI